jgi:acetyl/propionyl-CoA carboxylase alpha subunit
MERALDELVIVGVQTIQPLHRRVLGEPEFRAGRLDIGYLERQGAQLLQATPDPAELEWAAAAVALAEYQDRPVPGVGGTPPTQGSAPRSPWLRAARLDGLR